jgi:Uma2 family endonuclease
MGLPRSKPKMTIDEYLTFERAAEERHQYIDGEIFAMAGESPVHGDVSLNLAGVFYNQLKGKPCRARTKDTKVRSGPTPMPPRSTMGMFSYPDIVVICGEPEYHDAFKDVVLNPTAIAEVLSPSTEAFDKGEKFERYKKWNSTLKDHILVSQNEPRVEHHSRQADGSWTTQVHTSLQASVFIASIDCTLKLADLYDRVLFPKMQSNG